MEALLSNLIFSTKKHFCPIKMNQGLRIHLHSISNHNIILQANSIVELRLIFSY